MKNRLQFILLLLVSIFSFIACRKGTLPEEHYFGSVTISQKKLDDSPNMDVYFDDKKIGTVLASGTTATFTFPANKAGKLSIYKTGTDTLVADTSIIVPQNRAIGITMIYSDLLGIKGFFNGGAPVGADSAKLQFIYKFDAPFNAYPEVDLYVLDINRVDTFAIVKGLKNGQLSEQTLTLLHLKDGSGIFYNCMLKDVSTGEFIKMKYKSRNYFGLLTGEDYYNGHYNIVQISDDNGDVTNNKIQVNVTTL